MTEKYSTKNYKPGYCPARLQHNYKMTYENAYNLAQDLNNIFNRLYMVEQEKKEYRKETERLREALEEIKNQVEQAQDTVYPFSGSGTTAIACYRGKRQFLCVEKDEEYFQKSVERLEEARKQMILL